MANDTNGLVGTDLYRLLPEAYISTLQLICAYLDLKNAESRSYSLLEDGLEALRGLAQKHLSDGVSHVAEIAASYGHRERYASANERRFSTDVTFLVPTQHLQTFRDVTNDNILKQLSRSTPKIDLLQVLYNIYLVWLQSLSPRTMEWHFHLHDDNVVRFCATMEDFSITDCTAALGIITYLLRTLSVLLGYGDVKEEERKEGKSRIKHANGELQHCDGSIAQFLESLLKFSYVNCCIPHAGWEFKNRVCKYGNPLFPSLELYRRVDVSYHNACGLLSGPSAHMAAVVCQACELIHLDGNPLRGDIVNVVVLSFALANSSSNEVAVNITSRMLLKCIEESPADIRLHSHVLEPAFVAQNVFLNGECSDPALSVELYVKLMVTLMDDTNDKAYVVLERLMDRLIFLKCQDATVSFLKCYSLLLDSVPLACSVTLMQLFELLIITVDARKFGSVTVALECLEAVFICLPEDANMFWLEVCHWFLAPYMLHLRDAEIDLVNTVLSVIEANTLLKRLRFKPPSLEGRISFDKFTSKQRDDVKRRYSGVWKLVYENNPVECMHNRLKELRDSLEDQLRVNGVMVATEGVQATSDYYSWLITLTSGVNTDDSVCNL